MLRYQDPNKPARNIGNLLKFLEKDVGCGREFVYRGQAKEYSTFYYKDGKMPLMPSIYRDYWDVCYSPRIVESPDSTFGNRYVKIDYPYSFSERVVRWIQTGGLTLPFRMNVKINPSDPIIREIIRRSGVIFYDLPLSEVNEEKFFTDPYFNCFDKISLMIESWLNDIFSKYNENVIDDRVKIKKKFKKGLFKELIDYIHRMVFVELITELPYGFRY